MALITPSEKKIMIVQEYSSGLKAAEEFLRRKAIKEQTFLFEEGYQINQFEKEKSQTIYDLILINMYLPGQVPHEFQEKFSDFGRINPFKNALYLIEQVIRGERSVNKDTPIIASFDKYDVKTVEQVLVSGANLVLPFAGHTLELLSAQTNELINMPREESSKVKRYILYTPFVRACGRLSNFDSIEDTFHS